TFFNPARMLILLVTIAAVVAAILKTPCRAGGWGAPEVYFAGCYADWTGLWTSRGFADDPWAPFRFDSGLEYPILIAVVASILAWLAHAISAGADSPGIDGGANGVYYERQFVAGVAVSVRGIVVVAKLARVGDWGG